MLVIAEREVVQGMVVVREKEGVEYRVGVRRRGVPQAVDAWP